jgi:hypothetical protein
LENQTFGKLGMGRKERNGNHQWEVKSNFLNRKAWTKIPRDKADRSGKKILKVKWVFKKKDEQDGSTRYKSRIVTKGYLQIPGVDYTESFAPVATDTTIVTHNCFV